MRKWPNVNKAYSAVGFTNSIKTPQKGDQAPGSAQEDRGGIYMMMMIEVLT